MYLAYLDEAGATGRMASSTSPVQPVFIPAAIICKQSRLRHLTLDFLHLKHKFYPELVSGGKLFLDRMLAEIKGSEIRKHVRGSSRRRRRHALGFLDSLLDLLESHEIEIIGRVWVKEIGRDNDSKAMYTYSTQDICAGFQTLLEQRNAVGAVIADSRNYPQNANLSHSIFTKKYSSVGDRYQRIVEMPTFGHSDNHAGLQIADLICSALLFPMATYTYCYEIVRNIHVDRKYEMIKARYSARLRRRLFTYQNHEGKLRGGITVSDGLGQRPSHFLWKG